MCNAHSVKDFPSEVHKGVSEQDAQWTCRNKITFYLSCNCQGSPYIQSVMYDQVEIQNSHNSQYFELSKEEAHLQFVKALYCF